MYCIFVFKAYINFTAKFLLEEYEDVLCVIYFLFTCYFVLRKWTCETTIVLCSSNTSRIWGTGISIHRIFTKVRILKDFYWNFIFEFGQDFSALNLILVNCKQDNRSDSLIECYLVIICIYTKNLFLNFFIITLCSWFKSSHVIV